MRISISTTCFRGTVVTDSREELQYEAYWDVFERRWELVEILKDGHPYDAHKIVREAIQDKVKQRLNHVINSVIWL